MLGQAGQFSGGSLAQLGERGGRSQGSARSHGWLNQGLAVLGIIREGQYIEGDAAVRAGLFARALPGAGGQNVNKPESGVKTDGFRV